MINLYALFEDKYEYDTREPLLLFDLPGERGSALAVVPFKLNFWIQSFLFLGFQSIVNCVVALAVHFLVVRKQGTPSAYLAGYGLICPVLIYLPFVLIETFDIRNIGFILCVAGTTPALLLFRCIEAIHGTLPVFTRRDNRAFLLYFAGSLQFCFDTDGEPIKFSGLLAYKKAKRFVSVVLQTSLLYSFLIPASYELFPLVSHENTIMRLLSWRSIANNLSMAALTSLTLEAGAAGLGLLTSLVTGIDTISFSDSPLSMSESPSDFWGRRWNKVVESGLRRGVYIPARKAGLSRLKGAGLTFLASGLLHEYMLLYMTTRGKSDKLPSDYRPEYGSHLLFFLWCGVVLVLESAFCKHPVVLTLKKRLIRPARTFLVLLTVLPIGHFFTDEYVANFFYYDIAMGFPHLRVLKSDA